LPAPRGGNGICLIGNPPDYILIFGGSSEETIPASQTIDATSVILKKTLTDMWVYDT